MSDSFKHFSETTFEQEIRSGKVLVDFYADWCGPCRMLTPILEEVAKELAGKVVIGKVDIEQAQQVATSFQVTSIPTLVLFENGKEIGRIVGVRNKETIKDFVLASERK